MKTRKPLLIILICCLLHSPILALSTKPFNSDSPIYKLAYSLCISNGVNPPTSVSPMTAYEIIDALDNIPLAKLDKDEQNILEFIKKELDPEYSIATEHIELNFSPIITPEILAHTTILDRPTDYYQIKDRNSIIDLSLDLKIGDSGYAFGNWLFIANELKDIQGEKNSSNFSELTSFQKEGIFNSGIYLANEYSYGGIFKTSQEMGYGKTGNLMVSDNFSRQDFLRYKIHSDVFDYTFNLTQFDQAELTDKINEVKFSNMKYNGMKQYQAIHRFEVKFSNTFQFVFQEGSMLNVSNFDTRMLNPFVYFHGLYNFSESKDYTPGVSDDESNNYIVVELGYTPMQHLRGNFQFLMDQIQVGGERTSTTACPEAFGLLLNLESPWTYKDKYFNMYYEGVYIWPYTYLNLKVDKDSGKYNTNLDMITGYHNQIQDEVGYAGYTYGNDVITNSLGFTYGKTGLFDADFSINYIIHGKNGFGYETIIPPRGPANLSDKALVGVGFKNAEHTLKLALDANYYVMEAVDIQIGLAYLNIWNYKLDTNRNISDLQFKFAVSIDPVKLLSNR